MTERAAPGGRPAPDVSLVMEVLTGAVRSVGSALDADRCWLYARDPATATGVALVRWLRTSAVEDVPEDVRVWSSEPPDLRRRDPLFARALNGTPVDAIHDVTEADVDVELERALGHRAFVHVNLDADGALWGVLQPGMSARPRAWTAHERAALVALRPALATLVVAALSGGRGRPPSCRVVG